MTWATQLEEKTVREVPLIYTINGNVPVDSLVHKVSWSDDAVNTIFTESYFSDGELVKQSVHVMAKVGNEAAAVASAIG